MTEDAPALGSSLSPYIKTLEDGSHRLLLRVEGMHCARCIWAIESALQKEQDVRLARVNLSTQRLTLEWSGAARRADAFAEMVERLGYKTSPLSEQKKTPKEDVALLRSMVVAGFAMGNVMLISVALWSSEAEVMGLATRDLMHWLSAAIALPAIAYAGRPFFSSAFSVLRYGRTNMDVPISLALILASGMSLFETIRGGEHAYFDSAVMLMFFLLIGRWLDVRARGKAREHASELLEMLQGTASLLPAAGNGAPQTVMISQLKAGDMVRVAAGEKIPTDVEVLHGSSEIDAALVTGESMPRSASVGDTLFGGTINLLAPLTCRVLQASESSLLAEIIRLMEQAEQGRSGYVRLADRAAQLYTPVVHTLAAGAFLGWYLLGGLAWQDALMIAITTLIITCPCALGLAVPVVQVLAVEWLMKCGILVKSGDALERLNQVDVAVFDKTGTLTMGRPVADLSALSPEELSIAAALADHSKHPLSCAVSKAFDGARLALSQAQEVAGQGVEGVLEDGRRVFLGKGDEGEREANQSSVVLQIQGRAAARIYFSDALRPDAKQCIEWLQQQGMQTQLLSGDRQAIADMIAAKLGIEKVCGDLLPNAKLEAIKQLQEDGKKVLMVGDGLNDAPSLAQANASISPSSGMDMTQNTADFVFQSDSLMAAANAVTMARYSTRLVRQNFALALAYNCVAIPLALAGFVTPFVAAIAMSSSSLLVIASSFRIRLKQPLES